MSGTNNFFDCGNYHIPDLRDVKLSARQDGGFLQRELCDQSHVTGHYRSSDDDKSTGALRSHRGEGAVEIAGYFHSEGENCHAQRRRDGLDGPQLARGGAGRVEEDGDARGRRDDLLEELEPFGDEVAVRIRQPREIAARR